MGPDAMILVFWMLNFKPTFSLSSFTFIKRLFSSSSLYAIRVVSSAYLRLLIFLLAILIPACGASPSPAFLMMYSACKLNKQGDNSLDRADLEPAACSMYSSGCWFLTCIQVSQEAGQVVWHSHLLKNFPQFTVIHTVTGFDIVKKAEIDVFLELSCFFDNPVDAGNLISGSSAFSKTSLNIWNFTVHIQLKAGLENFEHYFASVWDECNCVVVWAFSGIAFLWDWNENGPFPVLWPLLSFQICWHIECSTFTASSFRIWNSSTGIPPPPLALFIVMLSKAHLTSHYRMSGSRWVWVITPSWLSELGRSFLYSFPVYSCHLFLISSASVRSIPFLSFIEHFFAWNVPLLSLIFLKISLVFPILLFSYLMTSIYVFSIVQGMVGLQNGTLHLWRMHYFL